MIDLLHAFAVGIAFSVGVVTGAILCQLATRKGREEAKVEYIKHYQAVEDRLMASLGCHQRMASSIETISRLIATDQHKNRRTRRKPRQ